MLWSAVTRSLSWGPWQHTAIINSEGHSQFIVKTLSGVEVARTPSKDIAELIAQVPDLCEPILRKGRSNYEGIGAEASESAHERGRSEGYATGFKEGEAEQGEAMSHWQEEYEERRMETMDDLLGLTEGVALILSKLAEEPIGSSTEVTKATIRKLLDWRMAQMQKLSEKQSYESVIEDASKEKEKVGRTWGDLAVTAAKLYKDWSDNPSEADPGAT
jgi:hypothetical protein